MVQKIEYGDRGDTVSCYLPEGSVPDKSAVEELRQMTGLEETLEKLGEYPGFFQGNKNRIFFYGIAASVLRECIWTLLKQRMILIS